MPGGRPSLTTTPTTLTTLSSAPVSPWSRHSWRRAWWICSPASGRESVTGGRRPRPGRSPPWTRSTWRGMRRPTGGRSGRSSTRSFWRTLRLRTFRWPFEFSELSLQVVILLSTMNYLYTYTLTMNSLYTYTLIKLLKI